MSSVEHFEGLLNDTCGRLQKTCDEWQRFLDVDPASKKCPEDALCEIMSALGKTNLLLKSKLPQFRRLVEDLRHGQYGQRPITPGDLQGFWDLIGLEIGEVDDRFEKIAKRKELDWAAPEPEAVVDSPRREKAKNGGDKPDSAGKGKSFDHLRSAAKARLALAKAKMQESMKKTQENGSDANENGAAAGGIQCNVKCSANQDRDLGRLSIC